MRCTSTLVFKEFNALKRYPRRALTYNKKYFDCLFALIGRDNAETVTAAWNLLTAKRVPTNPVNDCDQLNHSTRWACQWLDACGRQRRPRGKPLHLRRSRRRRSFDLHATS